MYLSLQKYVDILPEYTQWAQTLPECYMNVHFWSEYSGPIMNISAMFRS